jgi:hypothetical protein
MKKEEDNLFFPVKYSSTQKIYPGIKEDIKWWENNNQDDKSFLPSKYLNSNLKSRKHMVDNEFQKDKWENDIPIIYNREKYK